MHSSLKPRKSTSVPLGSSCDVGQFVANVAEKDRSLTTSQGQPQIKLEVDADTVTVGGTRAEYNSHIQNAAPKSMMTENSAPISMMRENAAPISIMTENAAPKSIKKENAAPISLTESQVPQLFQKYQLYFQIMEIDINGNVSMSKLESQIHY